ncbi:MAG: hypothetical protein FWC91_14475 [Defluviitaleaceae bacterium]|nr:hypothetical protein [Defluviitaleaceae bacterium]
MSIIEYISFPRTLETFYQSGVKGREKEFGMDISESTPWGINIWIMDNEEGATFKNCFKNTFIYGFAIALSQDYYEQRSNIILGGLGDEIIEQELKKIDDIADTLRDKTLYNFLNKILNPGEFVEIYTTWHDHINFNFGSPTTERTINLEEILTITTQEDPLEFDTSCKLTICKTK